MRPRASRAPRWAAVSMPRASPDTTVTPAAARSRASARAKAEPERRRRPGADDRHRPLALRRDEGAAHPEDRRDGVDALQPRGVVGLVPPDDADPDRRGATHLGLGLPPGAPRAQGVEGRGAQQVGVLARPRQHPGQGSPRGELARRARSEPGDAGEGQEIDGRVHESGPAGEGCSLGVPWAPRGPISGLPEPRCEKALRGLARAPASLRCPGPTATIEIRSLR